MKHLVFVFIIIICIITSCSGPQGENKSGEFDISGTEYFYSIINILEEDGEPAPDTWEALFSTPGYKVLTESEFSRDHFIDHFRLAFMPSRVKKLEDAIENGKVNAGLIEHYRESGNQKEEVMAFAGILQSNKDSLMRLSVEKALEYLPDKSVEKSPPVSFLVFAYDARGYLPVVIDILFAKDLGEMLPLMLAHEFHHYYRNMQLEYEPEDISDKEADLIWVMDQIQCEGIADQIDKEILLGKESSPLYFLSESWNRMVENAPSYIEKIDSLLSGVAENIHSIEKSGTILRQSLPMSGHPVGFYMANLIIEEYGKDELVSEVGNPFAFFRRYNEAVNKANGGLPGFSKQTMTVIEELEYRYIISQ